jgi:hypothetical protein
LPCYRQEAHTKERVWQLVVDNHLPERIAAWTIDLTVAKTFKGGVPPPGLHGVIFKVVPPTGSVILNLVELYRDADFLAAVEGYRNQIVGWSEGAGQYQDIQREIILELESLNGIDSIFSFGGFSGSVEQIAQELHRRAPSATESEQVSHALGAAGLAPGDEWWLSETGTRAVLGRIEPRLERLREKRQQERP